jgi:hypothetical protein
VRDFGGCPQIRIGSPEWGNSNINLPEDIAMKHTLATTAIVAALIVGSVDVRADDVYVTGGSKSPGASAEDKAESACFQAFIKKIAPDSNMRVRVEDRSGGSQIFTGHDYFGAELMDVDMTAKLAKDNHLLARGYCTVNSRAKVINLSSRIIDPVKLAAVTLKDLKLASVAR